MLFFAPCPYSQYGGAGYEISHVWGFGEPLALKTSGDSWGTLIAGEAGSSIFGYGAIGNDTSASNGGFFLERVAAGTGSAVQTRVASIAGSGVSGAIADYDFGAYPDAINGRLRLSPPYIANSSADLSLRATVPGVLWALHTGMEASAVFTPRDTVPGTEGRRLMHLFIGYNSAKNGAVFIDITGPWR